MDWYISTTGDISYTMNASGEYVEQWSNISAVMAARYSCGLELAEFCMGDNIESTFETAAAVVQNKTQIAKPGILHAPFNELFPCAIDKKAAQLAELRYLQAIKTAKMYGISKVVVHSGYAPSMYFDEWFVSQSVSFWKSFVNNHPGNYLIFLENVMETSPVLLKELMEKLNCPQIKLCLDIGHVFRNSEIPIPEWIEMLSPWIRHFHIHNNYGKIDSHNSPDDGLIDVDRVIRMSMDICPEASYTLEALDIPKSCKWLAEKGYIFEKPQ